MTQFVAIHYEVRGIKDAIFAAKVAVKEVKRRLGSFNELVSMLRVISVVPRFTGVRYDVGILIGIDSPDKNLERIVGGALKLHVERVTVTTSGTTPIIDAGVKDGGE